MGISSWGCSNPGYHDRRLSLGEPFLCRWPWWMYPVGGEKIRCVKTVQVKFNGIWGDGVGYYASVSMWRWYLHVFVGSYVSFGRSPYRRVFRI